MNIFEEILRTQSRKRHRREEVNIDNFSHSRPQSSLSLWPGGALARENGGSGDTWFDWLKSWTKISLLVSFPTRSYFSERNSVSFPERYSKSEKGWGFDILCMRSPGVREIHANAPLCTGQYLIRMDAVLCVSLSVTQYIFLFKKDASCMTTVVQIFLHFRLNIMKLKYKRYQCFHGNQLLKCRGMSKYKFYYF